MQTESHKCSNVVDNYYQPQHRFPDQCFLCASSVQVVCFMCVMFCLNSFCALDRASDCNKNVALRDTHTKTYNCLKLHRRHVTFFLYMTETTALVIYDSALSTLSLHIVILFVLCCHNVVNIYLHAVLSVSVHRDVIERVKNIKQYQFILFVCVYR